MAGQSWLVDSNRIATKIRSASGLGDPARVNWKSNPSRPCPNCQHIIDNSDVTQEWPGLPKGVKFDPANIELDTPPDFRLSQLEFGSQESFLAWGGSNVVE
ncbi:hypothetical protein CsSME_00022330 [Camellia sinensis var. sinensis]